MPLRPALGGRKDAVATHRRPGREACLAPPRERLPKQPHHGHPGRHPPRSHAFVRPAGPASGTAGQDPRFTTCTAAIAAGYGPYVRGRDPEYPWYVDGDSDGTVCE